MANNNLKRVLDNEGITQVELSRASGVSTGTINKVYNQRRIPALKTMNKLIRGLNELARNRYTLQDIFPGAGSG